MAAAEDTPPRPGPSSRCPPSIAPTVKHRCPACKGVHGPITYPQLPCLSLIKWNPPTWVPSESAVLGPLHVLRPSRYYGAQGSRNAYLPPPTCRARSRKVWHEHRKWMKRRHLRTPRRYP
ncbi:E1^E4 [Camelus dromedarius papillomavirus 2]|uniref:E1^E4 n=1 Tax=Camelus dromedarius papillomavirus 2 TaxID=996651 RepID=F2YGH7_9PAPI|nr:E1^E4 [Camelus dromedarius papillomavirus 2]ADZ53056.1 E1^E4 [Camelus dromedarius papillomavirus 2]